MKLDSNDFLDINGNFYTAKADAFIHYGLIQLAGKKHVLRLNEPVYFYNQNVLHKQRNSL